MAPAWTASPPTPTNKRTSSQAGFELPNATKLKQHHSTHKRSLKYQQSVDVKASSVCQDYEAVRQQVTRSISLALEAVGFDCAEPLAVESFRNAVEECMLRTVLNPNSSNRPFRYEPLLLMCS